MSVRAAASRYARALFDVGTQEGRIEALDSELRVIVELLERHPELHRALTNPSVPVAGKRGILEQVAARLQMSAPLARLLQMLAERDRLHVLPDLAEVFHDRRLQHEGVLRAEVTTAMPLSSAHEAALVSRLSDATGRRVAMTARVDPSIIGGVVTRIGSTVYDASVARQLTALRRKLAGQV
jgi:F-type H+-transporting ATPase subunit delta